MKRLLYLFIIVFCTLQVCAQQSAIVSRVILIGDAGEMDPRRLVGGRLF